ncbi:MAG: hypothetical protein AB8G77_26115 [Rhodothermales bacterium]
MAKHPRHIQADPDAIEASDILSAQSRILESEEFSRSKRAAAFLRFVVEEHLAGRGDRLKSFTIACEVYGRDETFDPRTDTIVRVEARRLRDRLAAYYQKSGHDDPVRIEIPLGGYSPVFQWNLNPEPIAEHHVSKSPAVAPERPRNRAMQLSGALMLVVLVGWFFFSSQSTVAPSKPTAQEHIAFLVVLPLVTHTGDFVEDRLAAGLVEAVITDLTKLSGLSVMAHASLLNLDSRSTDLDLIGETYGATHVLRGSMEHQDDRIRVNVQLIDILSSSTIWADRLDAEIEDLLALQDVLTERIVNHLAVHISPEERTRVKQHHSSSPEALALHRQALLLMMPPNNIENIITARNMFQRIIEIDPDFGGGYAGKGFSHSVTVLFLKSSIPDAELEIGKDLALKAIEVDPDFGMGYVTLAFTYALSGRVEEALINARRAIEVQPGDAFTQFVYGMCLTLSSKPRDALLPLSEAIRLDPAEPRTPYRNVLGIAHYLSGEHATAARLFEESRHDGGPTGPHVDAFRAINYLEMGNEEQAKTIIQSLIKSSPGFPVESWLAIWLKESGNQAIIMENMYRLGLPRKKP